MADLVQRDGLDVEAPRDAGIRRVDHAETAELKKMSDSTISPVVVSMKKFVAASVRSSSGRFWKPSTVAPSPEVGLACVNPTKLR